jgi:hypothetical protein
MDRRTAKREGNPECHEIVRGPLEPFGGSHLHGMEKANPSERMAMRQDPRFFPKKRS